MAVHNRIYMPIGEVFGRWTTTSSGYPRGGKTYVNVRCTCGNARGVRAVLLKNGKSKGCMSCSGIGRRNTPEQNQKRNQEHYRRERARMGSDKMQASRRRNTRKWRYNNPEQAARLARIQNRKRSGALNPHGETKGGACEICGLVWPKLHYDHSHATGLFRGWLCTWCNQKLGWFEKHSAAISHYLSRKEI